MNDTGAAGRKRAACWIWLPVVLSACAAVWLSVGAAHASDDIETGRALAERLCARCHMAPGQGEKRGANDIPGFAAIAERRNQTHEGIVAWLRSIPPVMPNHHLSQDEMHALAAYIVTLGAAARPVPKR